MRLNPFGPGQIQWSATPLSTSPVGEWATIPTLDDKGDQPIPLETATWYLNASDPVNQAFIYRKKVAQQPDSHTKAVVNKVPLLISTVLGPDGTQTNTTITAPANLLDNDIIIISFYIEGNIVPTPPPGFSTLAHDTNPGTPQYDLYFWWKRAFGETGDYTITHASAFVNGWLATYRGAVTGTNPFEPVISYVDPGSGTIDAQPLAITERNETELISASNFNGGTWTPASGFTEQVDYQVTTLDDDWEPPVGTTPIRTLAHSSQNRFITQHTALKSEVTPGPLTRDIALTASMQVQFATQTTLYPGVQAPPFQPPAPLRFNDAPQSQVFPKRRAQQPPSYTEPPRHICPQNTLDYFIPSPTATDGGGNAFTNSRPGGQEQIGETFIPPPGSTLGALQVYLQRVGSPTGAVQADLYAVTGTWPNVTPTGSPLVSSDPIDMTAIGAFPWDTPYFNFPNQYALSNIPYAIVLTFNFTFGGIGNSIAIMEMAPSANGQRPTGQMVVNDVIASPSWINSATNNLLFYLQGENCTTFPRLLAECPTAHVRERVWAQQPDSNVEPVFVPTVVVAVPFFECTSVQVFPKRVAQQPASECAPIPLDIRETFERAWDNTNVIPFRPRAVVQQPPARAGPEHIFVPAFFLLAPSDNTQKFARRWAQQPPSYTEPPFQPPYNDASSTQKRARIWAQQPPSETKPEATLPDTWFEAWRSAQERFYPKGRAQQPDSYVAPVDEPFIKYWDLWRQPQPFQFPAKRAQQPPSECAPPFIPPYNDASSVQIRKRFWAQQESVYPWLVEVVPEEFFEDWQTPFDRFYPKRVAQQPASETKPEATIPDTYFEAWRSAQERFYPKRIAQQPPAEVGNVLAPGTPTVPTFFDAPQAQVFPRHWAQQPPSEAKPVATIPDTWFEVWRSAVERLYPKAIPQQPPSYVEPPFAPPYNDASSTQQRPKARAQQPPSETFLPLVPLTWTEGTAGQVLPPRRAQQPASETAPLATPAPAAPTYFACDSMQIFIPRRAQQPPSSTYLDRDPFTFWDAWEFRQERFYAKRVAQQPPSEAKPEATLPSTFFDAWENKQDRFYPKAVPQQPPSESKPVGDPNDYYDAWENRQERFYAKGKPTQPPSTVQPEATLPSTFFESWRSQDVRYYPKAVAQQPPSESAPVVARQVIVCTGIPSEEAWGIPTITGGVQPPVVETPPGGVVVVRRAPRGEPATPFGLVVPVVAISSSETTTRASCVATAPCSAAAAVSSATTLGIGYIINATSSVASGSRCRVRILPFDAAVAAPLTGTMVATADAATAIHSVSASTARMVAELRDDTMLGGDGMLIGYPE